LDRCDLSDAASFVAIIRWSSTGVPLISGFSEPNQLSSDPVELSVSPSSEELGGILRLQVCVVLDTSLPDSESLADPLVPNRCGAVLWESAHHIVKLEGEADRFPIITLDFEREPWLHKNALWALRWTPDEYTAAASHAVQLLINTQHPKYPTLLESIEQGRRSPLVSTLYWDIARQMIEHGVDDENYHTLTEWPEGSIGAVIANLLGTWFPLQDLDSLRQMRSKRPHEFHSTVQGVNRLTDRFVM
jgi:hypothetical protein